MIVNKQNEWWDTNLKTRYNEFVSWLGTPENVTRLFVKDFIINNHVSTILDTACGPCIDFEVLKETGITYKGLDSTKLLVDMANLRGIDVTLGNVEELPFPDKSFDLVYGRHILEHLEYYEKAMREAVRCASKYIIYTFFLDFKAHDEIRWINDCYGNFYNLDKMMTFIKSLGCTTQIIKPPFFENQTILVLGK